MLSLWNRKEEKAMEQTDETMHLVLMKAWVYLTGSKKETTRALYRNGCRFYIKWYGKYIEVYNRYHEITETGWLTVENY